MKGLILSLKDVDIQLLPYWKCLLGHDWQMPNDPWLSRKCSKCSKYQEYELVNCRMNKTWVWRNEPNKQDKQ